MYPEPIEIPEPEEPNLSVFLYWTFLQNHAGDRDQGKSTTVRKYYYYTNEWETGFQSWILQANSCWNDCITLTYWEPVPVHANYTCACLFLGTDPRIWAGYTGPGSHHLPQTTQRITQNFLVHPTFHHHRGYYNYFFCLLPYYSDWYFPKKYEITLRGLELNQNVSLELEELERKSKSQFLQKLLVLPKSLRVQAFIIVVLSIPYFIGIAGGAEYGYSSLSDRPYCRPDKTYSISQTDRSDTQQQTGSITLPTSQPTNNPIFNSKFLNYHASWQFWPDWFDTCCGICRQKQALCLHCHLQLQLMAPARLFVLPYLISSCLPPIGRLCPGLVPIQ